MRATMRPGSGRAAGPNRALCRANTVASGLGVKPAPESDAAKVKPFGSGDVVTNSEGGGVERRNSSKPDEAFRNFCR